MALKAKSVPAANLNTTLSENQIRLAMQRVEQGAYKLIYLAPERLTSQGFCLLSRKHFPDRRG